MDFFLQFPHIKATRSKKKAVDATNQKRTGPGGAKLFGSISLLGGIFGFLHHGIFNNNFPTDSNST